MREMTELETMQVGGGGIYTDNNRLQLRDMAANAIIGGMLGGPVGFAGGLVLGAITGYRPN